MSMIIHLCFLLTVTGTQCHKITFDSSQKVSPCTTGLRGRVDRFFANGTVAVADYLEIGWQNYISIQAVIPGDTRILCPVYLTTQYCNYPNRLLQCYCNDKNVATGEVHFVVNYTIFTVYSEAIIRAFWLYNDTVRLYSNTNVTLPEIYDLQKAQLNLTVYGVMGNLSIPGSCNFSLTLNRSNHLRLCCFNTPTPCYPRISFGADVVSSDSCVSYPAVPLISDGVTRNLVLSFSACNQVENIAGGNCQVTTTPGVYVPATETPGTRGTPSTMRSPATGVYVPATETPGTRGTPATRPTTVTTTTRTLITSTSNENSRRTNMPFLWTTDMIFKRGDDTNVLTTFGPGLLIAGLSFVVAFAYVFWVIRETSDDNQPFNDHPEAGEAVEEKDSDKHSEAVDAAEEKDSDTLKQEDNSSTVSTLKL